MRSIFLSPDMVFSQPISLLESLGASAPATDLALLSAEDDGFLIEAPSINYYLSDGAVVNRFGAPGEASLTCAVRPALYLDRGEEALLRRRHSDGTLTTVEYGRYPYAVLDESLRELAARDYARGALRDTGRRVSVAGVAHTVYSLGAKEIICLSMDHGGVNGFVRLSDGSVVSEGDMVFLEMRPVRWLYDELSGLLVSCMALFAGLDRDEAMDYLQGAFLDELCPPTQE